MPRYFFNFVSNHRSFLDKEGVELAEITHVREYAHKRAAELKGAAHTIEDLSGWRMQICDEHGDQIFSLLAEPGEIAGKRV